MQLLLAPTRIRIWLAMRASRHMSEETRCDLIDSIVSEGGQKSPQWCGISRATAITSWSRAPAGPPRSRGCGRTPMPR